MRTTVYSAEAWDERQVPGSPQLSAAVLGTAAIVSIQFSRAPADSGGPPG